MTSTEAILRNFLYLSLGGVALACAGPIEEGGSLCFNIDEGETCPSMEVVNAEMMPIGPSCIDNIEHLEATDGPTQSDTPISGQTPVEPDEGDSCCYTTDFRKHDGPLCMEGRPLLESGEIKVAHTKRARVNPWRGALPRVHTDVSRAQRLAAGAYYLQTALYEHASVASFQKFGMELMRFGAPPQLLSRAQDAARDEISHAQMGFAIASDLLNDEVQPGTLEYTPHLSETLREFAAATLSEGAIGETLAVLFAVEQLAHATDPAIRTFLEQVITDESKHAELAWETLRWCIQQDPSIRSIIEAAIAKGPEFGLSHYPEQAVPGLGLPVRDVMKAAVLRGFKTVILPSLHSLLEI